MAVQGAVVPGIPINLAFPNYSIRYNFGGAPDLMTWASEDGSEAGIAPFVRIPGAPIWSRAPETILNYIERFCGVGLFAPYKFVFDASGVVFVNTNTFPAYATADKQFVRIVFSCGVLGVLICEAQRTNISAAGFARYIFSDDISFTRYNHGIDIVPDSFTYAFDDLSEPPNPPPAGFTHGGSIVITIGGGIGAAWDNAF